MSRGDQPTEPQWLAKPSSDCCLKGHLHTGEPKGTFERLAGIETYVTQPKNPNGHIILYYPDVFGFFTNGLLVMDQFAEAGYLTIGIDYFQGDPIYLHREGVKTPREGFDFEKWLAKHQDFAKDGVGRWVAAVKEKYHRDGTRYACTGYCFGAPYVMDSLAGSSPVCDAGAICHPAFLTEDHFHKIERPLFFSCAETDFTFETEKRNKAVQILRDAKKLYHLQVFSGVEHGFALRCDLSIPYERWVKEQSIKGISSYFDVQLGVFDARDQQEAKL